MDVLCMMCNHEKIEFMDTMGNASITANWSVLHPLQLFMPLPSIPLMWTQMIRRSNFASVQNLITTLWFHMMKLVIQILTLIKKVAIREIISLKPKKRFYWYHIHDPFTFYNYWWCVGAARECNCNKCWRLELQKVSPKNSWSRPH